MSPGVFQSPTSVEESSLLKQFDVNGDGKLDADERAKLTAFMDENGLDRSDWTIGIFGDEAFAEKQSDHMDPEDFQSQTSSPIPQMGHILNNDNTK